MTTDVDEFLEHFGVKGQKWGVRRNKTTGVRPIAKTLNESKFGKSANARAERRMGKQNAKADKKWEKNIYTTAGAIKLHNATAKRINKDIPALNARHKSANLNKPNTAATKAYVKDYNSLVTKHTSASVKEVFGSSPSGKLEAKFSKSGSNFRVVVKQKAAQHATDTFNEELVFELIVDDQGHIIKSLEIEPDAVPPVAQSVIAGEEFLEHYGVKGQKWGVRRKSGRSSSPSSKSIAKTLSDDDLSKAIKRMELEKRYVDLSKSGSSGKAKAVKAGSAFVAGVGLTVARNTINTAATNAVNNAIKKVTTKK